MSFLLTSLLVTCAASISVPSPDHVLPHFLSDNPLPYGSPWGEKTSYNSNPHTDAPATGVTRHYNFTLAHRTIDVDGIDKLAVLVNDQFPGPLIEANWGDWIEVIVNNQLQSPVEGTTLHWHGFTQRGTPWYDGSPAIGQCPVAPGASFTYRFRADSYGTSWYHTHYSAQYADGAVGPMVIYGPKNVEYDYDLGPIMLTDYYHRNYLTYVADAIGTSDDFTVYVPPSDNNLINGRPSYKYLCRDASMLCNRTDLPPLETLSGLAHFRFRAGKTHRLRLVNTGAAAFQYFSIDEHELEVITNDFVPLQPYKTNVVSLGIGQRADVLVHANGDPTSSYWMRASVGTNCSRGAVNETKAIIQYDQAASAPLPSSRPHRIPGIHALCKNDDLHKTVPFYPVPLDPHPEAVKVVELNFTVNSSGNHIWTMNDQTYRADYNHPLLLEADRQQYGSYGIFDPESLVYDFGSSKTVRVVLNNAYQAWHPMHLHGYHMQVIAEGAGYWVCFYEHPLCEKAVDGKTIVNPANPLRRDTHILRRYGHLVVQITANNPGIWPFHCHIAWHLSAGLNVNLMTQPHELQNTEIPYVMGQTCADWRRWSAHHTVDQIDAGL